MSVVRYRLLSHPDGAFFSGLAISSVVVALPTSTSAAAVPVKKDPLSDSVFPAHVMAAAGHVLMFWDAHGEDGAAPGALALPESAGSDVITAVSCHTSVQRVMIGTTLGGVGFATLDTTGRLDVAKTLRYAPGVHRGPVTCTHFCRSGPLCASGSIDRAHSLWSSPREEMMSFFAGQGSTTSNHTFIEAWARGCQFIPMFFWNWDQAVRNYSSRFAVNNRCGYVLKPEHLRISDSRPPTPMLLRVRVLCGNQLPSPPSRPGSTVDPYVVIVVQDTGAKADLSTGRLDNAGIVEQRTRTVRQNGFNPTWDESFEFRIANVECATATLRVMTKMGHLDEELSESTCPLISLRRGIRAVPLYSCADGSRIHVGSLVCHFDILEDTSMQKEIILDYRARAAAAAAGGPPAVPSSAGRPR